MSYKNWILSRINKQIVEKSIVFLLILALVWQFAFPKVTSLAYTVKDQFLPKDSEKVIKDTQKSPLEDLGEPKRVITVPITAYSSTIDQCDSTPCNTANGFDLCKHNKQDVIATNFLPLGTKVRFPDYDPDTIYTVQDRMNARYYYRADIWMKSRQDAKIFGIKNLKMEIYQ